MNTLLIWDNTGFTTHLSNQLDIHPDSVILSLEALRENKFLHSKDAVIVLLETNKDKQKRSDFYGLKIIKELRKELRYKGLIMAYSFCDEKYFRELKGAEILFTSGTRLKPIYGKRIDADEIETLIQNVPKLSNELLDDITFSAFDTKGRIHEYLHNLKNDLNVIDTKGSLAAVTKNKTTILESYKKLLLREIDPQRIIDFNKLFDTLIKETIADVKEHWERKKDKASFSYTNAGNQVSKFSNQIAELAPVSSDDSNNSDTEKINWEVLFFDDKKDVREIVANFFKTKNVVCHLAATEEEVYQKLKDNSPNISLFISDIRLLDKNGHWCDRQGYDIIEQVNKTNEYPLVYSVLTSKKGTINKMVQKKRKYEILWFTKDDVINNIHSFNIFFDLIKRYSDENFNSNTVFQPEYGFWNKPYRDHYNMPLKAYYKHHKESHDYLIEESVINKRTLEWLEAEGVKLDWMSKFLKTYIGDVELKKFRETKLLGRRIALAFAAEGQATKGITVYNLMNGSSKNEIDSSVKVFFSKLALSTNLEKMLKQAKDYYKGEVASPGILYEEFEFLKNEFFEEQFIDSINLGYERVGLQEFVEQIQRAFTENNIAEPKSFTRLHAILENAGIPKAERFDAMFTDLKHMDEQSGYKLLKEVGKHKFLNSVTNETIRELLVKYDLI
jgi:CheY-like chemotaxis protein